MIILIAIAMYLFIGIIVSIITLIYECLECSYDAEDFYRHVTTYYDFLGIVLTSIIWPVILVILLIMFIENIEIVSSTKDSVLKLIDTKFKSICYFIYNHTKGKNVAQETAQ